MMNKKAELNVKGLIMGIIVLLFLLFLVYNINKDYSVSNNDCLKEIAEDYCKDNNMYYYDVNWNFKPIFYCKENERGSNVNTYLFLESEEEKCL